MRQAVVNQALSACVAQTAKVLPHSPVSTAKQDGREHNKKLRILSGQSLGEKINEVLEGKDTLFKVNGQHTVEILAYKVEGMNINTAQLNTQEFMKLRFFPELSSKPPIPCNSTIDIYTRCRKANLSHLS